MKRTLSAVAALLCLAPASAWACKCALEDEPPEVILGRVDTVVEGHVVSAQPDLDEPYWDLKVSKVWKGKASRVVRVTSTSSSCGTGLGDVGRHVVLGADLQKDGTLHIRLCSDNLFIARHLEIPPLYPLLERLFGSAKGNGDAGSSGVPASWFRWLHKPRAN